ncbi:MAG: ATP-dependent nuclease [Sarcina sp.]
MKINCIYIENFKSIKKLKIKFDKHFNLIIGKNNIGKTTIFEALLLWKRCYDLNFQSKKKSFYSEAKNIAFSEVKSLRIYEDNDLFNEVNGSKRNDKKVIQISVEIEDGGIIYNLGFKIKNLIQEKKTYLQVSYINKEEFKNFEELSNVYSKSLSDLIVISKSKPVANISRKEPYMYRDQVISKIEKGKGTEVLRNKFVALNKEDRQVVEKNISDVIGKSIKFIEENGKKEYIKLKIDMDNKKVDILSQGSGFLQLVEIFTTVEYKRGILNILLIDEPDAHLHAELQMNLVNVIKEKEDGQVFIISHNERFLTSINDENIIFMNEIDKEKGEIKPLNKGGKRLVLENLVDNISEIQELQYINKLILVEGYNDLKYVKQLYEKYKEIVGENNKKVIFKQLRGIDEINTKLKMMSVIYEELVNKETQWIVIKDRDLIPTSRLERAKNEIKGSIREFENKQVFIHKGYEIYSTIFSEIPKLLKFILMYYELNAENTYEILIDAFLKKKSVYYLNDVITPVGEAQLYSKMKLNFERQQENREGKVYDNIDFNDFLKEFSNDSKIEFIMDKKLIDIFLNELHQEFASFSTKEKPTIDTLFDIYINSIKTVEDFYLTHKEFLDEIYK